MREQVPPEIFRCSPLAGAMACSFFFSKLVKIRQLLHACGEHLKLFYEKNVTSMIITLPYITLQVQ